MIRNRKKWKHKHNIKKEIRIEGSPNHVAPLPPKKSSKLLKYNLATFPSSYHYITNTAYSFLGKGKRKYSMHLLFLFTDQMLRAWSSRTKQPPKREEESGRERTTEERFSAIFSYPSNTISLHIYIAVIEGTSPDKQKRKR